MFSVPLEVNQEVVSWNKPNPNSHGSYRVKLYIPKPWQTEGSYYKTTTLSNSMLFAQIGQASSNFLIPIRSEPALGLDRRAFDPQNE